MIVRTPDASNLLNLDSRNEFNETDSFNGMSAPISPPHSQLDDRSMMNDSESVPRFDQELERAEAMSPVREQAADAADDQRNKLSEVAERISSAAVVDEQSQTSRAGAERLGSTDKKQLEARVARAPKRSSISQALLKLVGRTPKTATVVPRAPKAERTSTAQVMTRKVKVSRPKADPKPAEHRTVQADTKSSSKQKRSDGVADTLRKAAENIGRNLASTTRMGNSRQIWRAAQAVVAAQAQDQPPSTETEAKMESTLKTVLAEMSATKVGSQISTPKVQAPQMVRDMQQIHQRIMDHIDTLQLSKVGRETQMTVKMGELGDIKMNVRMAQQVGQTGQLQVVLQATDVQAASMLKDGIAQLAETLEGRGYKNTAIEVRDASASETDTRRHRQGQNQGDPNRQWKEAADNEAFAAATGRRYRDAQQAPTATKGVNHGN